MRDVLGLGRVDLASLDTRPHEAVLLGAPYDGGELILVTTTGAEPDGGRVPAIGPLRAPLATARRP